MSSCQVLEQVIQEQGCDKKCLKYKTLLDECGDRIESVREHDAEATCEPQFFDYLHCLTSCSSKPLFKKLV